MAGVEETETDIKTVTANWSGLQGGCALSTFTADPGLRSAGLHRNRSCHRQWRRLPQGRDFAAWVGVVPRQYSTGGKPKLFGMSKRGNVYLRKMLIHGARAVVFRVKRGGFWAVDAPDWNQGAAQQGHGRYRQQTRTHGLGRVVQRQRRRRQYGREKRFPFPTPRRRGLDSFQRSAEERRRRKNSPTACRKTWAQTRP